MAFRLQARRAQLFRKPAGIRNLCPEPDRRAALLAELLYGEGQRVHSFALERAALPKDIPRADHLQGALYGADAVILPLPLEKGGYINAPYARTIKGITSLYDS